MAEGVGARRLRYVELPLQLIGVAMFLGLPFFGPLWKKSSVIDIWPLANDAQRRAASRRTLFDGIHFPVRAADVPAQINFLENEGEEPTRFFAVIAAGLRRG